MGKGDLDLEDVALPVKRNGRRRKVGKIERIRPQSFRKKEMRAHVEHSRQTLCIQDPAS